MPTTNVEAVLAAGRAALSHAQKGALQIIELFQTGQDLVDAGHRPLGIKLYHAWLANTSSPLAYAVQFNLAVMLGATDDTAGAEAAYRMALAQNPQFNEAHLNLGTLLERLKRPDEALASWNRLLEYSNPELAADKAFSIQALNNLGRLMEIQKNFPGAEDMLTRSLRLDPKQKNVITHWVHLRQKQCKWPVYSSDASGIAEEQLMGATSALAMLSASGDPAQQLAASRRFVADKVIQDVSPLSGPQGYGHDRLRIGYLSSDFCSHAVSILTAELYGLHDRSKVQVFGFDWSNEDGSPLRARVLAGMDHHIRIHTLSDEEAARLIRLHEIDILVDLHGLTLGARPNILAYRPAPVQVTWLGLPGPTGMPSIDYVIADPFVLPPELEPYFTEKPLHMPRTFQINDRQRIIGPRPTRAANRLPEDAFVFCAFNNNFKVNPEMFATWMRILQRVPGSLLWMVADIAEVRTNLARQAELAGVAKERLVFAERVVPSDYLARYQVADLFLDTAPFNGGTTASDALWAGLPVITCAGRTFSSRMAGSLLHAVDLPQLITTSLADYEALAVELALDRPRVAALKSQLHEQRLNCALFDSAQFVRDLEQRFEQIALKGNAGLKAPQFAGARAPEINPALPKVAILMPTHNRPEYAELALQSILAQTWGNLEIVISDNSDNELTRERFAPYLARYPYIRYLRSPGMGMMDNFFNCYHNSTSEFINYLMDDDLFHPDKISRMMACMLGQPNIGLVTSFRQLIDAEGRYMAPLPGTERLFEIGTAVGGASLGDMMLSNGRNMVGEPTTVLFRRSAVPGQFGMFLGRQYVTLSDVATWLAAISNADCIYLPEALSYFRIHDQQDQRNERVRIQANIEWMQLLCDAHEHGKFVRNRAVVRDMLTAKLPTCIWYLSSVHEQVEAAYDLDKIYALLRQAMAIILNK
ncbi:glycosyltransferase [Rugamonas sp.]|uniref:O-linked N-acetylglucosamine transferase family protein n=1 Tax=Rugamonas sp. TaxID=1926287 RepID=UPI0025E4950A|nr:glycosyltransferase [Rugamonas sp.]